MLRSLARRIPFVSIVALLVAAPMVGATTTQDTPIAITGTDFDPTYVIPIVVGAMGAWLIGSLALKGGIAGIAGIFKLVFRGSARLIGMR